MLSPCSSHPGISPPKGEHSYLLSNQLGRVSMLAKSYRNDGLPLEASLQNLKIAGCTYSLQEALLVMLADCCHSASQFCQSGNCQSDRPGAWQNLAEPGRLLKWLRLLVTIIVPRLVVFILKKIPLTPNSSLLSMFKTNKHPGGQPPANIISTHFKRLKKLANKSGCYYQK